MTRRALITGAAGQLGQALGTHAPEDVDLVALTRSDLDIANPDAVSAAIQQHEPDVIINCAAYTNVNGAESERDADG